MAEFLDRRVKEKETRGTSIYSIVSAQAGGISDAFLRGIFANYLEAWKTDWEGSIKYFDKDLEAIMTKTPAQTVDHVYDMIKRGTTPMMDSYKAGLGLQAGTALMSLQEAYSGFPQIVGIYKLAQINAGVRPKVERWWMSKYAPEVPDVRTAFKMLMEKQISRAEFNTYCGYEGWHPTWHDKLYEILNKEPDEYLAFSMYKRGLLTKAEFYECLSIAGYDASWHTSLEQALHRRPTYRELINLADFVPLPTMWVSEVLRAQGYTDGDINYIVPAIELRPLREEIRSVVGRLLWQYQIGRRTRESLEEELTDLELQPKEIELNMTWGDLRYEDELTDNKVEIIRSRVEAGDPALQTQEAIKDELVALGIAEEMANLMAEDWYYDYIYTP